MAPDSAIPSARGARRALRRAALAAALLAAGSAAGGGREGDLERALEECDASIRMQERGGIPEPGLLAATYRRRAGIHESLLDYASAHADLERACDLHVAPGAIASCREDLAGLERGFGDLDAARKDYEEAIRIREEESPDGVLLARALHASGLVLEELGDVGLARTRLERAVEIQQEVDAEDLGMATYLLGLAFSKSGNDEVGAGELARRALEIRQRELGPAAPETIDALEAVADIEVRAGSSREARVLLEQVVWYRQVTMQPEPLPARSMLRLSRLDVAEGRLVEACAWQTAAVASLVAHLGAWAPEVASARAELARTLLSMNRVREAFRMARESEIAAREHRRLIAQSLPEDAALRYAAARGGALDVLLTIAARRGRGQGDFARAAWDELVRSRAVVRDELARRARASRYVPPGAWAELASAREHLAGILVRDPAAANAPRYAEALEDARDRETALARALSRTSAEEREEVRRDRMGLEAILSRLPAGTALLSYARYESADAPSGTRYVAFLAIGGSKRTAVVPLGSAADVRPAIWDSLAPSLRRARELWVVPDGSLDRIDLGALPLLREEGRIRYLSAERDVLLEDGDPAGAHLRFGRTSIFAIMPPSP